jgi:branched-chain amino acid transport system permease protein
MVTTGEITLGLINGLTTGFLLFLAAVGLTMVFGVLNVLNFAHGSFYMLGAYFTWILTSPELYGTSLSFFVGSFWISMILAVALVAVVGGIVEILFIRRIYDHDHIFQLLLTFALVLVIDFGVRIIWGTEFRTMSVPPIFDGQVSILGRTVPMYNVFIIAAGFLVAVVFWLLLNRTQIGKQVRAAAEDRETTAAMGINVPVLYTGVFIVGSALAGLGGALAAPYQAIQPTMGENIIIEAFIVVVIGGLGSFTGAFVVSLAIGVVSGLLFHLLPGLQSLAPYLLMILVLMIRPSGLFGGRSL